MAEGGAVTSSGRDGNGVECLRLLSILVGTVLEESRWLGWMLIGDGSFGRVGKGKRC